MASVDALLAHGFAGRAERIVARVLAALQAVGVCAVFAFPAYRAYFVPAAEHLRNDTGLPISSSRPAG